MSWGDIYHKKVAEGWDNGAAMQWADEKTRGHTEHETSPNCWCEPELDYVDPENGNEVWVHREIQ